MAFKNQEQKKNSPSKKNYQGPYHHGPLVSLDSSQWGI